MTANRKNAVHLVSGASSQLGETLCISKISHTSYRIVSFARQEAQEAAGRLQEKILYASAERSQDRLKRWNRKREEENQSKVSESMSCL